MGGEDEGTSGEGSTLRYHDGERAHPLRFMGFAVVAFAVALLIAYAQSEDDGSGAATLADAVAPDADGTLSVSATEFAFDPAAVALPADVETGITLVNDGSVPHNWTVLEAGVQISSEAEFDEGTVAVAIADVEGGAEGGADVALAAGEYQVICTISGHFDAGMEGVLVSREG